MDITCTKLDLLDSKEMRPKIRSTDGLIKNVESRIMPRRDDISWESADTNYVQHTEMYQLIKHQQDKAQSVKVILNFREITKG